MVLTSSCIIAINALLERLSCFNLIENSERLLQREVLNAPLETAVLHAQNVLELVNRDRQRIASLRDAAHCGRVRIMSGVLEVYHGVVQEEELVRTDQKSSNLVFCVKWRALSE